MRGGRPVREVAAGLAGGIAEAEWAKLTGTTSQPFAAPPGKPVAVKVISHSGDEMLKVLTLPAA